jgi:hypothetical protein
MDIGVRFVGNLIDRVSGPMKFRFVLQPTVALCLAVVAGLRDAEKGKPPYLAGLLNDAKHRVEMLRDGWRGIGKVFIFAVLLDVAYQIIEQHAVYPGETLVVACVLAIAPYVIVRGLVTRVVSRWR